MQLVKILKPPLDHTSAQRLIADRLEHKLEVHARARNAIAVDIGHPHVTEDLDSHEVLRPSRLGRRAKETARSSAATLILTPRLTAASRAAIGHI